MAASVTVRYEDDSSNPVATRTAVHVTATGFDYVDETDNSEIRYYLSAETDDHDAARSVVFSGPGPHVWDGWIAPDPGAWNFFLRQAADDVQVANTTLTYDTAS